MRVARTLLTFTLGLIAMQISASAVPCSTGTLDFTATSNLPFTGTTFNVGQSVTLTAQITGFTPSSLAWSIDGPHIKDYDERVGTVSSGAIAWSTTPLSPADLSASPVSFYWKPDASQIHPLAGGPVTRNVTLTATVGATTCTATRTYSVERNSTDVSKQAEDYFTSNHKAPTEPNNLKGLVIDYHMEWHTVVGSRLLEFLPWHREFLARFNSWRTEFGYPPIIPWYPGNPIPTGTDINHSPRLASFDPDVNRLPTWFSIAGGSTTGGAASEKRLADYTNLNDMSDDLEFSYHGQVHCDIGPNVFGGMCNFSSPKDPIFFRWHNFVDLIYMNYCGLKGLACAPGQPPQTDAWMADNPADLANNGTPPSPSPHYISPDIWNRTSLATCSPTDPLTGVVRNCGTSADHENPIAGAPNFLYATLRNDRPGATMSIYVEVAVYIAHASTGLSWPTSFGGDPDGALPETRQFITLNLAPGQTTSIGPVPWTPPPPSPSDHFCLYVRVLNVQETPATEGTNIDLNTRDSNSIAWRNVTIVNPPGPGLAPSRSTATFTVRNIRKERAPVDLEILVPQRLLAQRARVELLLSPKLAQRWIESRGTLDGFGEGRELYHPNMYTRPELLRRGLLINQPKATLRGIVLAPQEEAAVTVRVTATDARENHDILIQQRFREQVEGGILVQVRPARRRPIIRPLTIRRRPLVRP
jgi:hypothetical protein